jgi:hypothetical protein
MAELEKVIKGLELCLQGDSNFCELSCPYYHQCGAFYENNEALLKDALALLKAHVMTLEEVHEMAWDYCYLEEEVIKDKVLRIYSGKYRIKCITWPSIASCTLTFGDEAYGKRWRCWTSRPTEEQRTETPWGLAQDDYDEHRFSGLLSEE